RQRLAALPAGAVGVDAAGNDRVAFAFANDTDAYAFAFTFTHADAGAFAFSHRCAFTFAFTTGNAGVFTFAFDNGDAPGVLRAEPQRGDDRDDGGEPCDEPRHVHAASVPRDRIGPRARGVGRRGDSWTGRTDRGDAVRTSEPDALVNGERRQRRLRQRHL